jgi:hypothetical protein
LPYRLEPLVRSDAGDSLRHAGRVSCVCLCLWGIAQFAGVVVVSNWGLVTDLYFLIANRWPTVADLLFSQTGAFAFLLHTKALALFSMVYFLEEAHGYFTHPQEVIRNADLLVKSNARGVILAVLGTRADDFLTPHARKGHTLLGLFASPLDGRAVLQSIKAPSSGWRRICQPLGGDFRGAPLVVVSVLPDTFTQEVCWVRLSPLYHDPLARQLISACLAEIRAHALLENPVIACPVEDLFVGPYCTLADLTALLQVELDAALPGICAHAKPATSPRFLTARKNAMAYVLRCLSLAIKHGRTPASEVRTSIQVARNTNRMVNLQLRIRPSSVFKNGDLARARAGGLPSADRYLLALQAAHCVLQLEGIRLEISYPPDSAELLLAIPADPRPASANHKSP